MLVMRKRLVCSLALLLISSAQLAQADQLVAPAPEQEGQGEGKQAGATFAPRLDASYFWDDGAIPFVYGTAVLALSLRVFAEARETPLLFSASEGGAEVAGDTVPSYVVGVYAAAGAGLLALTPTEARLHHFKGYGEAVLTTIAVTEVAKKTFGRHRPDYAPGDTDPDQRQSFFSGHSSITAATSVYLGLYFYEHLSPRLRGPAAGLFKVLVYSTLAGVTLGMPLTRLEDNRHHPGDVVTGAAVGSVLATAFFAYQEARFRSEREGFYRGNRLALVVLPDVQNRGLTLATRW